MRSRSLSQFKITVSVFLFVFSMIYLSSKCISLDQIMSKGHISHFSGYEYNYKNNMNDTNHHDSIFGTTHDQAKYPFTVVTAASENHFCAIQSWIYYMKGVTNSMPLSKRPRIIIYDIGLLDHQSERLRILHKKGYFAEFRAFDFEMYPEFWRIVNGTRGEYGWKPGIISEVARDYPGQILWLDSGSYVTPGFLKHFRVTLNHYDGFFSPTSSGYMSNWTHPGVFEYFNDHGGKYSKFVNCNGAAIAFDSNKVGAMMNNWVQCALVKDCIAPKGSSRVNHRQDQAVLTYLVAREKRLCVKRPEFFGLRTHMDKSCKKNIYSYEKLNNIIWS